MNITEDFSSDTSDEDYIPEESDDEVVSDCDENSERNVGVDCERIEQKSHKAVKRKNQNGLTARKRRGGIILDGEQTSEGGGKQNEENGDTEPYPSERTCPNEGYEDEKRIKKRADDLWSSFKKDTDMKPKSKLISSNSLADCSTKDGQLLNESSDTSKPVTVTKVYEFAGEEVRVTEQLDAAPTEARKLADAASTATPPIGSVKKPSGLGNVLSHIGSKKKISTLEKSRLDWNQFKQAEGIQEELSTFNKGKDGYLEKQAFLERADLRQFEIERNLRMSHQGNR